MFAIAIVVALAAAGGAWLVWRGRPAIALREEAPEPAASVTRAPASPGNIAPREEIREGERRALEKLLEEKRSRADER
jgi:hypothetical protein